MRLWHQQLIPYLPRQQLLGQHRECCALRGAGWGRKHSTVDYVFTYSPAYLIAYHYLIMDEMEKRGYHPDEIWRSVTYRGKTLGADWSEKQWEAMGWRDLYKRAKNGKIIYIEHNQKYLIECLENLKNKGIEINLDV